jgi:hypothetical protein
MAMETLTNWTSFARKGLVNGLLRIGRFLFTSFCGIIRPRIILSFKYLLTPEP